MEDHTMLTMAEAATRKGAAGPSGPGVRSDLNVVASVEDSGGIRISLTSKVEVMYGA